MIWPYWEYGIASAIWAWEWVGHIGCSWICGWF